MYKRQVYIIHTILLSIGFGGDGLAQYSYIAISENRVEAYPVATAFQYNPCQNIILYVRRSFVGFAQ